MADLGKADRFLHAADALKVGINRGIGIPCPTQTGAACVLTLLSANSTPIARRLCPELCGNLGTELPDFGAELEDAGLKALVVLPLLRDGVPAGAPAWYF
jgi:hypothetical protein